MAFYSKSKEFGPLEPLFSAPARILKGLRSTLFLAVVAVFLFPDPVLTQPTLEDRSMPSPSLTADPLKNRSELEDAWLKAALSDVRSEEEESKVAIENAAEGQWMQGEEDGTGLLKLYGRIRIRLGQGILLADRVIIDTERKELYAEGNLIYVEGQARVTADRLIYDQRLGAGILYNGEGYRQPIYFTGKNIRGLGEGRFSISHAYFTTCAAKEPHYNFRARKAWIYSDGRIAAAGVVYSVGGVPVLPLPFYYASEWGTGVISQFGHGTLQGYFLQNTYQFAVPSAYLSSFLPMAYRIKADIYEKTGSHVGLEMYRFSPGLSYVLDFGMADFKRYEIVADPRTGRGISASNQILQDDGTYSQERHKWYKAFALIAYQNKNYKENSVQKLSIRYEDYRHRLFETEFGGRYQPDTTIPALYKKNEAGRGIPRNQTDWTMTYNDQRGDLNITVKASRNRLWIERPEFDESRYEPTQDIAPSVKIEKKIFLGKIADLFPVYWDHTLNSQFKKLYSSGDPYVEYNENEYKSGLRGHFSLYPYITYRPSAGFGVRKTNADPKNLSTTDEDVIKAAAERDSYQYWWQEHDLSFGPHELFLRAVYRKKDAFKEELKDATRSDYTGFNGRQRVNEVEASINASPLEDLNLQVLSVYDFRQYEYDVPAKERWSYPVFRADMLFNMLGLFRPGRENLLSRRRAHFLDLRVVNDYVYDPILKRDHSNLFGVIFQAGGFDLWLLDRLRYLELGYYWYHVYYDPSLDHMRFSSKLDVKITKWLFFEMELESRLTRPDRYDSRNYDADSMCKNDRCMPESLLPETERKTDFVRDFTNSLGVNGQRARETSAFNIGYFEGAFLIDAHDYEIRLGYALEQRSMLGGSNSVQVVNYYDNKIFASFTFLRFDVGGVSQRPSRFILNRQRVRPGDIGVQSIGP